MKTGHPATTSNPHTGSLPTTPAAGIRALRSLAGLTIERLASEAGTSASYISRVENGERKASARWMGRVTGVISLHLEDAR